MDAKDVESELRRRVSVKYGIQNLKAEDCVQISEQIFRETKNYVSQTNLQRFFKIYQPEHVNSFFVLNSLAQFLGFLDLEEFRSEVTVIE